MLRPYRVVRDRGVQSYREAEHLRATGFECLAAGPQMFF